MTTATLSPNGLSALLTRPRARPFAFVVWRLVRGRWVKVGIVADRSAANALATSQGIVLPLCDSRLVPRGECS